jgi:hypothetical protein
VCSAGLFVQSTRRPARDDEEWTPAQVGTTTPRSCGLYDLGAGVVQAFAEVRRLRRARGRRRRCVPTVSVVQRRSGSGGRHGCSNSASPRWTAARLSGGPRVRLHTGCELTSAVVTR